MIELFVVFFGVILGVVAGLLPGIGLSVTLVIFSPILILLSPIELIIFFLTLATTVQYTGTIPSVFFGIPGEANSLPASIEGPKFNRRNLPMLAIGGCALTSVTGAIIATILTILLVSFLMPYIHIFFNGQLKLNLYFFVMLLFLLVFNQRNLIINFSLMFLGLALSMPGESKVISDVRFTFGITDLEYGIPLFTILVGFIITPSLFKIRNYKKLQSIRKTTEVSTMKVFLFFIRFFPSSIRGSILGFFCGFVPGVSTMLATGSSYSIEKKINSNSPAKQLFASESANNSAMLSALLPLLILGIPITGAEVILYGLLVDVGWDPFMILDYKQTVDLLFTKLAWHYVLANILSIMVAWPLAKMCVSILNLNIKKLITIMFLLLILITIYMGYADLRLSLWIGCLILFSLLGILLRKYNCIPLIFMFIIGPELEVLIIRTYIL